MLFCSESFLIFFTIVFTLYWALRSNSLRVWLLLIASFLFYATWNKWLAVVIALSTLMDFVVGIVMESSGSPLRRKLVLALSLTGNLGLLVYFKYMKFFIESIQSPLYALGFDNVFPVMQVILPIGISFYTFEAINYTVDVYRRRIPAERRLTHFMLFITFFPHLVAGPIVRARDFLPQVARMKRWDWARIQLGAQFFAGGLFKKMAIADRMALFADPVFASPSQFGSYAVWIGTLAYTVQIYCDFSGYTDMALGCAHLLGYKLAPNFRAPYLSPNVSEFWRRWHMSLSTWLRDYMFIPLGGSRGSDLRTCRNLLVTMTLGGLWHGASWTFIAWGLMHGLLLIAHREFQFFTRQFPGLVLALLSVPGTIARTFVTFLVVSLGWILFRAPSFEIADVVFQRLFIPTKGGAVAIPEVSFWITFVAVAFGHILAQRACWKRWLSRLPPPALGLYYATIVTLALLLSPADGKPFVYFQF